MRHALIKGVSELILKGHFVISLSRIFLRIRRVPHTGQFCSSAGGETKIPKLNKNFFTLYYSIQYMIYFKMRLPVNI